MTKMTYVSALDAVLSGAEMTAEVQEKLMALKVSLEKRAASGSGKETKAQREAREFTEQVFEVIAGAETAMRCGDIAKALDVSGQKVSAALSKLVRAGRVSKTLGEKKVALFGVAEDGSCEAEEVE